ncbi:box C/D snoRNA protein 1-like [Amphibalanus amphitrite]|uniref:box C/D snoRNA protein 1-like n=1 Tax=Amphibalanus amphitrite TaxID=1232801 RepID=UPI001C9172AC|nr:box C/D snoRNA protein 1-like [Amphibalanus amphitrite]
MSENGHERDVQEDQVIKDSERMRDMEMSKSLKSPVCQQCSEPAKYTCPGCLWRTCSVKCIKRHKEETQCTGLRDKVKYKPMSQLGDLDILNDYRLLEEIGRQVEVAGRTAPRCGRHGAPPPLRPALHRLRRLAKKRGVRLDFLPESFERRRQNTTEVDPGGQQRLLWRVEWRLPLADAVVTDDKVPETTKLSEALGRHLSVGPATNALKEDPLQFYRAAFETGSVRVFLRLERVQQGDRYLELPLSRPLAECLRQQLVIEFPVLVVTTEEHAEQYRTDRIEASFFSLCKREEEAQRRARRAERRRGPADADAAAPDEPARKLPRPRLDGVSVAAAPPPTPPPAPPEPEPEELEPQPEVGGEPQPQTEPKAAAGFGLFGVDDSDLSD